MIPQFNITGQSVNPEQIVDIIPEQEKSDAQIQANEEKYFRQLQQVEEDKLRSDAKMFNQLADLSTTFGDILQKRQEKYRQDREAEISLEILTRGVSPELEARFRGERDQLFDDDLATQEFASKYEEETGDSITAQEFRKMAGWEKYMVAEQYALQKAKDYDQYVYSAYETTKIDVIRDGASVSVGHMDNLSPQEQAALDTKIKFEYAKQFAGLNPALVATVVKPEIDKFDEMRRKKQAVAREENYQTEVAASDSRMIQMGFVTANPEDGHQLAHDWAARYAARNRTTIGDGRRAFAENLVSLVEQDIITYPEAMSIVNHEITARDGSTKTMGSWKEWSGLTSELAAANEKGVAARDNKREASISADVEMIKSKPTTNEEKAIMMDVYRQKYDGYVPNEIADALRGHMEDWQAEDMIEKSVRYQGGVYDFEAKNLSTEMYNKHKDKILSSGAMVPGSSDHKLAAQYLRGFTNRGTEESFGETDTKSPEWLTLYGNLEEAFNEAYTQATVRDGKVIGRPEDGFKAGIAAVETIINNPTEVLRLQNFDTEVGDDSYSRLIQSGMTQSASGNWKKKKVSATQATQKELIAWGQTPLKQSSDIPDYYKDLAMRMGVNPVDLANSQLQYVSGEEVKQEEKKVEHSKKVEELVYKYPTRSRITRARIFDALEKAHESREKMIESYMEVHDSMVFNPNSVSYKKELPRDPLLRQQVIKARKERELKVKTSIFNKKALVRQDQ